MSNHIHPPRDNGGIIVGEKSPQWFTDYFGEYDTRRFAESGKPCAHCGKGKAMVADCYRGLCNACWTNLVFHCLEWARRWCDRRNLWGGDRPDTLMLALLRIRHHVERGTLDDLLAVAVDGANPKYVWRRVQRREYKRRWSRENYARNRDRCKSYYARHKAKYIARAIKWRRENKGKIREINKKYYKKHKKAK